MSAALTRARHRTTSLTVNTDGRTLLAALYRRYCEADTSGRQKQCRYHHYTSYRASPALQANAATSPMRVLTQTIVDTHRDATSRNDTIKQRLTEVGDKLKQKHVRNTVVYTKQQAADEYSALLQYGIDEKVAPSILHEVFDTWMQTTFGVLPEPAEKHLLTYINAIAQSPDARCRELTFFFRNYDIKPTYSVLRAMAVNAAATRTARCADTCEWLVYVKSQHNTYNFNIDECNDILSIYCNERYNILGAMLIFDWINGTNKQMGHNGSTNIVPNYTTFDLLVRLFATAQHLRLVLTTLQFASRREILTESEMSALVNTAVAALLASKPEHTVTTQESTQAVMLSVELLSLINNDSMVRAVPSNQTMYAVLNELLEQRVWDKSAHVYKQMMHHNIMLELPTTFDTLIDGVSRQYDLPTAMEFVADYVLRMQAGTAPFAMTARPLTLLLKTAHVRQQLDITFIDRVIKMHEIARLNNTDWQYLEALMMSYASVKRADNARQIFDQLSSMNKLSIHACNELIHLSTSTHDIGSILIAQAAAFVAPDDNSVTIIVNQLTALKCRNEQLMSIINMYWRAVHAAHTQSSTDATATIPADELQQQWITPYIQLAPDMVSKIDKKAVQKHLSALRSWSAGAVQLQHSSVADALMFLRLRYDDVTDVSDVIKHIKTVCHSRNNQRIIQLVQPLFEVSPVSAVKLYLGAIWESMADRPQDAFAVMSAVITHCTSTCRNDEQRWQMYNKMVLVAQRFSIMPKWTPIAILAVSAQYQLNSKLTTLVSQLKVIALHRPKHVQEQPNKPGVKRNTRDAYDLHSNKQYQWVQLFLFQSYTFEYRELINHYFCDLVKHSLAARNYNVTAALLIRMFDVIPSVHPVLNVTETLFREMGEDQGIGKSGVLISSSHMKMLLAHIAHAAGEDSNRVAYGNRKKFKPRQELIESIHNVLGDVVAVYAGHEMTAETMPAITALVEYMQRYNIVPSSAVVHKTVKLVVQFDVPSTETGEQIRDLLSIYAQWEIDRAEAMLKRNAAEPLASAIASDQQPYNVALDTNKLAMHIYGAHNRLPALLTQADNKTTDVLQLRIADLWSCSRIHSYNNLCRALDWSIKQKHERKPANADVNDDVLVAHAFTTVIAGSYVTRWHQQVNSNDMRQKYMELTVEEWRLLMNRMIIAWKTENPTSKLSAEGEVAMSHQVVTMCEVLHIVGAACNDEKALTGSAIKPKVHNEITQHLHHLLQFQPTEQHGRMPQHRDIFFVFRKILMSYERVWSRLSQNVKDRVIAYKPANSAQSATRNAAQATKS